MSFIGTVGAVAAAITALVGLGWGLGIFAVSMRDSKKYGSLSICGGCAFAAVLWGCSIWLLRLVVPYLWSLA